jgi:uncharacterized protein YbjQ (UPF0145 family)
MMVSTTNEVIGFKIVRHLGIVRGITVRSRSVVGNFVGGIQSFFSGQIGAYVDLAEAARQEAFDHMCAHAGQGGANAIIGMRYDANDIMDGITEVLAYGTSRCLNDPHGYGHGALRPLGKGREIKLITSVPESDLNDRNREQMPDFKCCRL